MLKPMHLGPPFDDLITNIIQFYQRKIDLHQRMIDISSVLLVGPKSDVDYDKMVTEIPKIRAFLDDIDHTLFQAATPMVLATLINNKPDSQNHLSPLVITKAEREKLVHDLIIDFGAKLEQKNQNYIGAALRSAVGLRQLLGRPRCFDIRLARPALQYAFNRRNT